MRFMQRLINCIFPPPARPPMEHIETDYPEREELRNQITATAMAANQITQLSQRITEDCDRFKEMIEDMRNK